MRSGVGHGILDVVMRQKRVVIVVAKCKLQHAHARQLKFIAQFQYIVGNQSEIFSDDGQLGNGSGECLK